MVHQTIASSSKYSLRGGRRWSAIIPTHDGTQQHGTTTEEFLAHPATAATVSAGLKPGLLTLPAEKKRYGGYRHEYTEARNFVLQQWWADPSRFLSLEECLKAAPDDRQRIVKEVYRFLHQQGCINFGVLRNDPNVPLPADVLPRTNDEDASAERGGDGDKDEGVSPPPQATEESIEDKLYEWLPDVDMETVTVKQLRLRLAGHFQSDISAFKSQIRERVDDFLTGRKLYKAWKDRKAREKKAAAAAAERKAKQSTLGRVVVIGAGPAGLSAALHLKRNGIDVTVLEARGRVGGRVHSFTAAGFDAPVDLGASIITGTEPDMHRALRSDPSAVLCAQLGVKLHPVNREKLPLHDIVCGTVIDEMLDKEAEKLMNELMDEADLLREDLPQAEAAQASFGELLDKAVQSKLAAHAQLPQEHGKVTTTDGIAADVAPVTGQPLEDAGTATADVAAADMSTLPTADQAPTSKTQQENATSAVVAKEEGQQEEDHGPAVEDGSTPQLTGAAADDVPGGVSGDANTSATYPPGGRAALKQEEEEEGTVEHKPSAGADYDNDTQQKVETEAEIPKEVAVTMEPVTKNDTAPMAENDAPTNPSNAAAAAAAVAVTDAHLRLLQWHWAHAEYGCSAPLSAISAQHWNQDEEFGGFGGPHCMVVGGYDAIFRKLARLVDVRLETPVAAIRSRSEVESVEVVTSDGESLWADAVIVTVPLGVLKAGSIAFEPPLPQWKQEAISRLGFGALNKVVLQFPNVFWDDDVDFFGAVGDKVSSSDRGWFFMFWNFHRFAGAPILAALVSGEAARTAENLSEEDLQHKAMSVLKSIYPGKNIPEPTACTVSRWSSDQYARGSYSYVAVGASGEDYDQLSKPVARRVLFAGEHTAREHPDTVGGAMLSGIREAARALQVLQDDRREGACGAAEVSEAVAELTKRKGKHIDVDHASGRKKKKAREGELGNAGRDDINGGKDTKKRRKLEAGGDHHKNGGKQGGEDIGDDSDEDDEEGPDASWKFDHALGRDVARRQEELRMREAAREAAKAVWRGLLKADTTGDAAEVLQAMQTADDVYARHHVASSLQEASGKAQQAIAVDARCLKVLTAWLGDATENANQVALVSDVLKALAVLGVDGAAAKQSGLVDIVRHRCVLHSDPGVRRLSAGVIKKWTSAPASMHRHHGHDRGSLGNGGASRRGEGEDQLQAGSRPGSRTIGGGREGEGEGAAATTPTSVVVVELDAEAQARLAAREEQARRLQEQAEKLRVAAEAQAAEAAAALSSSSALRVGGVVSFEEFRKAQVAAKRKPKTTRTTSTGGAMDSGLKHESQKESRGDEGLHAAQPRLTKQPGSRQGAGPQKSGAAKDEVRTKLDKLIISVLHPCYKSRRISKEQYKEILRKAGDKVWERSTPGERGDGRQWLESRKRGVVQLTQEYIQRYTAGAAGRR